MGNFFKPPIASGGGCCDCADIESACACGGDGIGCGVTLECRRAETVETKCGVRPFTADGGLKIYRRIRYLGQWETDLTITSNQPQRRLRAFGDGVSEYMHGADCVPVCEGYINSSSILSMMVNGTMRVISSCQENLPECPFIVGELGSTWEGAMLLGCGIGGRLCSPETLVVQLPVTATVMTIGCSYSGSETVVDVQGNATIYVENSAISMTMTLSEEFTDAELFALAAEHTTIAEAAPWSTTLCRAWRCLSPAHDNLRFARVQYRFTPTVVQPGPVTVTWDVVRYAARYGTDGCEQGDEIARETFNEVNPFFKTYTLTPDIYGDDAIMVIENVSTSC